ncbi:hypothetical protein GUJ93_ZPchr0011g28572 [Zizania palustris]|uniref:RRM domain-containing protein n=1 Tax=Zizania palustris TaxID=103762 RepID=A0A8J5WKE4_ZIZPA|nr:hypothetical protein GUJ93_ZPchr0011g28572 [Zizania palustris]
MFTPNYSHLGLLAATQIEPIVSGNLPPGFDSTTCRSVYVANIHLQVTDSLLQEVFQSIGPVEGCKLIRKEKSSFGFVDYYERRYAALAIVSLNGRQLFGQPIKVNWAYASTHREDTSVFLGKQANATRGSICAPTTFGAGAIRLRRVSDGPPGLPAQPSTEQDGRCQPCPHGSSSRRGPQAGCRHGDGHRS